MRLFVLLAVAAGSSAATAAEVGQFNLTCVGTETIGLEGDPKPVTRVFRIDVERRLFCADDCKGLGQIVTVKPDEIVFASEDVDARGTKRFRHSSINRVTGAFKDTNIQSRPFQFYAETVATCTPAAFTPFPAAKF